MEHRDERTKSRGGDGGPGLYFAAFGKHPGWNDHIDDLGLDTPRLVEIKRRMYVDGIGGNIDSGAWEKLSPEQQVEGFAHVFVWRTPGDLVIGRMWSSRDGKGRSKYPMVVCAECAGAPLAWALAEALPLLEDTHARCLGAPDAGSVRAIIDGSRAALRERARLRRPEGPELLVSDRVLGELAARPEMNVDGAPGTGVHRLLYQVEREMGDYLPVHRSVSQSRASEPRPRHMRVPACAPDPEGMLTLWMRCMLSRLSPGVEIVLLHPLGRNWVDAVIGAPDVPAFYCLRASPKALALVTDVPYDLDPEFVSSVRRQIDEGRSGEYRAIGNGRTPAVVISGRGLFSRLAFWRGKGAMMIIALLVFLALAAISLGLLLEWAPVTDPSKAEGGPPPGAPPSVSPESPSGLLPRDTTRGSLPNATSVA